MIPHDMIRKGFFMDTKNIKIKKIHGVMYMNSVIKEFCFFFRISETAFLVVNCRYGNSNIIY